MKEKNLVYINFGLLIILIVIVVLTVKISHLGPKKTAVEKAVEKRGVISETEKPIYDISKIKDQGKAPLKEEPKDLQSVYDNFPKEDVGDNVIEGWSKVNPKDKAIFLEGLDKKIASSKEALKSNPDDKKAKNILAISESLKKMASNNFNYKSKIDTYEIKK